MNNSISYDFAEANVLVTGGTSGIGYGIATAFADAGASVTVTGTRATANDYPGVDLSRFVFKSLKLQDIEAIKALSADLDGLDILVNNAGANLAGQGEWSHEAFEESVQINLMAAFHMSRACLEHLKASTMEGGASIVGIASLTSYFAHSLVPAYGAAKAGLVQLAKTMALTWAEHGIRANNVAAGMTETPMNSTVLEVPEDNEWVIQKTPVKRWGSPDDMAAAVLFLCSKQASFITGQTLISDGGITLSGGI